MRWTLAILLLTLPAQTADLDSYCQGACEARYQDGYYAGHDQCACVDYVPVNHAQRYDLPKRKRKDQEP